MRWLLKRLGLVIVVASLLLVALLVLSTVTLAQPMVCGFYGSVTVDGASVDDGTSVTAWIASEQVAEATTTNSSYNLRIAGSYTGSTVFFKVRDLWLSRSIRWDAGQNKKVDLNIIDQPQLQVPVTVGLNSIAGKYTKVWTFDAATQSWQIYDKAVPDVSDLGSLTRGQGYWLEVTEDATITYGGNTYRLKKGWNLIGWLG